jgi:hypothetical protein
VYRTSTGNVRPGIVKIGASKKYCENFTASNVADVTMSFSSGRFLTACFNRPKNNAKEFNEDGQDMKYNKIL